MKQHARCSVLCAPQSETMLGLQGACMLLMHVLDVARAANYAFYRNNVSGVLWTAVQDQ